MADYIVNKMKFGSNTYKFQDTTTPTINLIGGDNITLTTDTTNNTISISSSYVNTNTFKSFYGTCSTAAATAAKVVTLSTTTGWQLAAGTIVGVKFTNTNTYSATSSSHVTLNVNSTGAKNICYGSALPTGTNTTAFGRANYINYYMYDGSQWVWLSSSADNDTNNYVNQLANSSAAWRKVLGTHSSGTYVTSTITDNDNHVVYYDADGPAFNTSTGELYTKGYYMYLATTDALYTAIDGLGWTSEVIS